MTMSRRGLVGVSVAALAAGAGTAWWRYHALGDAAPTALWVLKFSTPNGGLMEMARFRGRPFLINFWATWCAPCVKEMPELDRFHKAFAGQGGQVVGLAVDRLEPVQDFLRRQPVSFPIGLAGLDGTDLSRTLGNEQGSLPFSVMIDAEGRLRHRRLGQTSMSELAEWARGL